MRYVWCADGLIFVTGKDSFKLFVIFSFSQAFLDAIVNLEFMTVESLWREFWRSQDNNNGDECEEEKYLSKYVAKLLMFCWRVCHY